TRVFDTDLELTAFNEYETAFDAIDRLLAVSRAALNAKLTTLNRLAPLLLIVPLTLAIGLLWLSRNFLRRSFVAPLNKLVAATNEVSRGELSQKVPEAGAAELATLSRAFNHMAAELAASRDLLIRAEKNATLSALVPVVAHNIRNPLSSIRATAQVLDDPDLDNELREGLRDIVATADRLEEWTRSLLSYLHPLEPQLARTTIAKIVDGALKFLQPKLEAKEIAVERENWEHAPEQSLDVDLLEQALHGLLGNAIDASPRGGKLRLAIATDAAHVKLTMGDQGSGIAFMPERKLPLTPGPTTKPFGTGLGIPFAMKVCEVHGGGIAFEKKEGTQVTITLPR
ncbi:MAG: sensor histidine kinase, partial [Burkholderiales bacterium]